MFYSHKGQHAEICAKLDLNVAENQRWIGLQISQFDIFFITRTSLPVKTGFALLVTSLILADFHPISFEFWRSDIAYT